jgi:hypothetical protein
MKEGIPDKFALKKELGLLIVFLNTIFILSRYF